MEAGGRTGAEHRGTSSRGAVISGQRRLRERQGRGRVPTISSKEINPGKCGSGGAESDGPQRRRNNAGQRRGWNRGRIFVAAANERSPGGFRLLLARSPNNQLTKAGSSTGAEHKSTSSCGVVLSWQRRLKEHQGWGRVPTISSREINSGKCGSGGAERLVPSGGGRCGAETGAEARSDRRQGAGPARSTGVPLPAAL